MNRCAMTTARLKHGLRSACHALKAHALRCARVLSLPSAMSATLLTALLATHLPAQAQAARNFPASALRGELQFQAQPEVLLNGQAARLAPGARVRGTDNLLQLAGNLNGTRAVVNYTIDPFGLVKDVWLLRPDEILVKPWPRTTAEAQSWVFNADAQTWSRP
jgi:hypothetical protein